MRRLDRPSHISINGREAFLCRFSFVMWLRFSSFQPSPGRNGIYPAMPDTRPYMMGIYPTRLFRAENFYHMKSSIDNPPSQ